MAEYLKLGDEVIKYRPYSNDVYCMYGGSKTSVSLGRYGKISSISSFNKIYVDFYSDYWCINPVELNLSGDHAESVIMYGSISLKEVLEEIGDSISKDLLFDFDKLRICDITYIELDPIAKDVVSYVSAKNFYSIMEDETIPGELITKHPLLTKGRNRIKIGRLVKKLYGDKYDNLQIEKFVNVFKSTQEKECIFKIVKGKDIIHWYNYRQYASENGTLYKSCMKLDSCQEYLKFYAENEDKVSLLILLNDSGKLTGRALLWNLDEPVNLTFMDRIYSAKEYTYEVFKTYARNNNFLYKENQSYGSITDSDQRIVINGIPTKLGITVNLKKYKFSKYPFLDTLSRLDLDYGILTNRESKFYAKLTGTSGNYDNPSSYYFDKLTNERILASYAVWCEYNNGWSHIDNVVKINYKSMYAIRGTFTSTFSDVDDCLYLTEDVIYSPSLGSYILKENAEYNSELEEYVLKSVEKLKWSDTVTDIFSLAS